jgi:plasmid rolling circle replication initiator protein Rep
MIDYPDARFIFLTLTVKNCPVTALRSTLLELARGWKRLTELRIWPAIGWIRSTEITRSERYRNAHPHFHALLMVPPSYFQAGYLKKNQWAELWRQCLRIEYKPVVHVKVIRQNAKRSVIQVNRVNISQMWAIVCEVLKYSVKVSDMVRDHWWFLTLVDEVRGIRSVAVGGALKPYLRKRKKENLIQEPGEEEETELAERLYFRWTQQVRRYRKAS